MGGPAKAKPLIRIFIFPEPLYLSSWMSNLWRKVKKNPIYYTLLLQITLMKASLELLGQPIVWQSAAVMSPIKHKKCTKNILQLNKNHFTSS